MAPPRSTKASIASHNTTTASATRQASKKTRKQADEESEDVEDADSMDVDGEEPEQAQTASAQELIASMVEGVSAHQYRNWNRSSISHYVH